MSNIEKVDKYEIFKLKYIKNSEFVGNFDFPLVYATQEIPCNVISFNEISQCKNRSDCWVDFFIDDRLFERIWNRLDFYIPILSQFKGVIAPDFSMFPEMSISQAVWNCYRSRAISSYLQYKGIKVIPVATWRTPDEFDWSFEGLPRLSSIAISTNGCLSNSKSRKIFKMGVEELIKQKCPTHLIVCGKEIPELNSCHNVTFYPSFSQRLRKRIKSKGRKKWVVEVYF